MLPLTDPLKNFISKHTDNQTVNTSIETDDHKLKSEKDKNSKLKSFFIKTLYPDNYTSTHTVKESLSKHYKLINTHSERVREREMKLKY